MKTNNNDYFNQYSDRHLNRSYLNSNYSNNRYPNSSHLSSYLYPCLLAGALIVLPVTAQADLFNITVSANGETYTDSFNDAEDSLRSVETENLQQQFSNFNENIDAALINLNYRGLAMDLSYSQNSADLLMNIPELNITQTFTGSSRDDSVDKLVDFLKSDGGDLLNRIMQRLAAVSPTDPIAGNPSSLMSMEAASLHDSATKGTSESQGGTDQDSNYVDFGLRFSSYRVDEEDINQIHLPLSYTVNLDGTEGHQLTFKIPVSYSVVNGSAESYSLGLGIGYTYPINSQLAITPGISYQAIGSVNQGAAAAVQSFSLTTRYDFNMAGHAWRFGNTLAHMSTAEVSFDDYTIDPNLSNQVMINGIMWRSVPITEFNVDMFLKDTRFFGDELYSERTNEVGFSVASENLMPDSVNKTGLRFRVGGSYIFTDRSEIDGFRLNMGASF